MHRSSRAYSTLFNPPDITLRYNTIKIFSMFTRCSWCAAQDISIIRAIYTSLHELLHYTMQKKAAVFRIIKWIITVACRHILRYYIFFNPPRDKLIIGPTSHCCCFPFNWHDYGKMSKIITPVLCANIENSDAMLWSKIKWSLSNILLRVLVFAWVLPHHMGKKN